MKKPSTPNHLRFQSSLWRAASHVVGLAPLGLLIFDILRRELTANPIQYLEQRTGYAALVMLVLSLVITPASFLTGNKPIQRIRRTMGLYAFGYALIHFMIFIAVDYGLNLSLLKTAIFEKRYILVGLAALTILTLLAATSFEWSKRLLRKNWKRLHSLVYLAAPLVILHFAWAKKGDIFRLQGDIVQALIFGAIVALLLIVRITVVKQWITRTRKKLSDALSSSPFAVSSEKGDKGKITPDQG